MRRTMDPNAALHAIRVEVASHLEHGDGDVDELVEHFRALDEWLASGGFKPRDWQYNPFPSVDEVVGPKLAEVLTPNPRYVRPRTQVDEVQRELDAHPNWRQS
jgi:hypothetical protein